MAKPPASNSVIDPTVMYSSIRQEVLDQKKCQFSLFGACVTLTCQAVSNFLVEGADLVLGVAMDWVTSLSPRSSATDRSGSGTWPIGTSPECDWASRGLLGSVAA